VDFLFVAAFIGGSASDDFLSEKETLLMEIGEGLEWKEPSRASISF